MVRNFLFLRRLIRGESSDIFWTAPLLHAISASLFDVILSKEMRQAALISFKTLFGFGDNPVYKTDHKDRRDKVINRLRPLMAEGRNHGFPDHGD